MPNEQSEFGRGLLVCLLSFIDHKSQILEMFFSVDHGQTPTASFGYKSWEEYYGHLWANGASDHLFELKIPKQLEGTPLGKEILAFKEKWLEIGHGYGEPSKGATKKEIYDALQQCKKMTLEIAAEIDKALGIKDAEVGQWN